MAAAIALSLIGAVSIGTVFCWGITDQPSTDQSESSIAEKQCHKEQINLASKVNLEAIRLRLNLVRGQGFLDIWLEII